MKNNLSAHMDNIISEILGILFLIFMFQPQLSKLQQNPDMLAYNKSIRNFFVNYNSVDLSTFPLVGLLVGIWLGLL